MNEIMCPHCQKNADTTEMWIRTEKEKPVAPSATIIQSLLTDEIEPEGDDVECMTMLSPCGHSFPRDILKTVERQRQDLDELLEKHDRSTNHFEIQLLREEIHSVRERLAATAEQCEEQMVVSGSS